MCGNFVGVDRSVCGNFVGIDRSVYVMVCQHP